MASDVAGTAIIGDLLATDRGISVGVMYPGQHDPVGIPLIRSGDLEGDRINRQPPFRISPGVHREYRRTELVGGELLMSLVGNVGRCAVVPPFAEGWNAARAIAVMRLKEPGDADFLRLTLRTPAVRHLIDVWSNTTVQQTLNLKEIRQLPVPWPTKSIRSAIVSIVGAFDDKIDTNRLMNETLEGIGQAIFKDWFIDFGPTRAKTEGRSSYLKSDVWALFPEALGDDDLPETWRCGELGEIVHAIDCLHSKKPTREEVGDLYLHLGNIRDDGLLDLSDRYLISNQDYQKWTSRIEASPGDCIITNVGRVGAVAQVPQGLRAAIGRNITALRCKDDFPYPTFLIEALLSSSMRVEIGNKTDVGTILNALNVRNIPKLRLCLPPRDVLEAFEHSARPLRAKMERNFQEAEILAATRDLLLPKLLSGEMRVRDAETIAEAVA